MPAVNNIKCGNASLFCVCTNMRCFVQIKNAPHIYMKHAFPFCKKTSGAENIFSVAFCFRFFLLENLERKKRNKYMEQLLSQGGCLNGATMTKAIVQCSHENQIVFGLISKKKYSIGRRCLCVKMNHIKCIEI